VDGYIHLNVFACTDIHTCMHAHIYRHIYVYMRAYHGEKSGGFDDDDDGIDH